MRRSAPRNRSRSWGGLFAVEGQRPQKFLHPDRQRADPFAKIVADSLAVFWIGEDATQDRRDAIVLAFPRQHVLQPVKRLDDAHARPASPSQLADGCVFETDFLITKLDRLPAG